MSINFTKLYEVGTTIIDCNSSDFCYCKNKSASSGTVLSLLPGEKEYLETQGRPGKQTFHTINGIDFIKTCNCWYKDSDECLRYRRGLICRLYPLIPIYQKDGSLSIYSDSLQCPFWYQVKNVQEIKEQLEIIIGKETIMMMAQKLEAGFGEIEYPFSLIGGLIIKWLKQLYYIQVGMRVL